MHCIIKDRCYKASYFLFYTAWEPPGVQQPNGHHRAIPLTFGLFVIDTWVWCLGTWFHDSDLAVMVELRSQGKWLNLKILKPQQFCDSKPIQKRLVSVTFKKGSVLVESTLGFKAQGWQLFGWQSVPCSRLQYNKWLLKDNAGSSNRKLEVTGAAKARGAFISFLDSTTGICFITFFVWNKTP